MSIEHALTAHEPSVLPVGEGAHLHFLNHLATIKVAADGHAALSAVEFRAPRSMGPPLHVHDDEDELFIVLDGRVAFRSGDTEIVGDAGAYAFLPRQIPHTFQVLSAEARFAVIAGSVVGAPQFDQMVAALGSPAPGPTMPAAEPIDPGLVADVCRSHGIQVLGPPPPPLD